MLCCSEERPSFTFRPVSRRFYSRATDRNLSEDRETTICLCRRSEDVQTFNDISVQERRSEERRGGGGGGGGGGAVGGG